MLGIAHDITLFRYYWLLCRSFCELGCFEEIVGNLVRLLGHSQAFDWTTPSPSSSEGLTPSRRCLSFLSFSFPTPQETNVVQEHGIVHNGTDR